MNCDGVRGLLSAYVDGELSAGELLRVEQHLRRCHWCADEVDALRQTIALVASLEEVEVPASFRVGLHERLVALGPPVPALRTASAHRARGQGFRRWAVPAAAAAALVIGVAGLQNFTIPQYGTNPAPGIATSANPTETPAGQVTSAEIAQNSELASTGTDSPQGSSAESASPHTQVADQAPQQNSAPTQPQASEPSPSQVAETGTGIKPELGPTQGKGVTTASVSFVTGISKPSATTQKHRVASLTVAVTDPAAVATELKRHFPQGAVIENRDAASGVIRLQIVVQASAFDAELGFVEERTGARATTDAYDLSDQMARAYDAIAQLDLQREQIADSLEGETNATNVALANQQLADLAKEAELAKAAYQKLVNQAASGTITVTLKPNQVR